MKVPPAGVAVKLAPVPVGQNSGVASIAAISAAITSISKLSKSPQVPNTSWNTQCLPAPASAGSKSLCKLSVTSTIPVPYHLPPGVTDVSFIELFNSHIGETGSIAASNVLLMPIVIDELVGQKPLKLYVITWLPSPAVLGEKSPVGETPVPDQVPPGLAVISCSSSAFAQYGPAGLMLGSYTGSTVSITSCVNSQPPSF